MTIQLGGIRMRLWLATALPAMLVIALLAIGVATQYGERLTDALKNRGVASARQLGSSAEFMLFADDHEGLSRLADSALRSDHDLLGVAIYSAQGQVKATAGQIKGSLPRLDRAARVRLGEHLLVIQPLQPSAPPVDDPYAPVNPNPANIDRLIGYVVLEMSLQSMAEQQHELVMWTLVTAVGSLVLAGLLATLISSMVTSEIGRINRVVERIRTGQLDARADVAASGILRPLAIGINAMIARIAVTQEDLQRQIAQATHELRAQKEAAEQTARTDALTGVASRRAFSEVAEAEMQRALRYRTELSLLMMDLDHFKGVNDTHGHVTGDAVLVSFAQTVLQQVRKVDLVARLGGEEFAVLLPNITAEQSLALAERIRLAFANSPFQVDGQPLHFSVSIGVAPFDPTELTLNGWLSRADAALYRAKARGRNCVELAPGLAE